MGFNEKTANLGSEDESCTSDVLVKLVHYIKIYSSITCKILFFLCCSFLYGAVNYVPLENGTM
ncbi:hypothetical protein ME7_00558 [Bartonella birtlesii LL-WM9]|uniref:Uncharacterized protein n=1 Tax=Bartonella birtlesii LL-WM9 TaxID=1094552 RepID=J0Q3H7_9HYPH|nr:hypothetical protein ME7_00558 [Bartonella birtlesii LL-WM9]